MTQDLNHLRSFVAVAKAGSFIGASQRLQIPRSSLSRHVKALEEGLGVSLISRTTRQLHLTDEGQQLFERAETSLRALDNALLETQDASGAVQGHLRITAPADLGSNLLHRILPAFQRDNPSVKISLNLSDRQIDLVGEGYDLAVRAAAGLPDSTLRARKLGSTLSGFFASPAYLKAHGTPQNLAQLKDHRLLAPGAGLRLDLPFKDASCPRGIQLDPALKSNSFQFLMRAAIEGGGIAVLPYLNVSDDVTSGRLVQVLPDASASVGNVYLVTPGNRHITTALQVLMDYLDAEIRPLLQDGPNKTLASAG